MEKPDPRKHQRAGPDIRARTFATNRAASPHIRSRARPPAPHADLRTPTRATPQVAIQFRNPKRQNLARGAAMRLGPLQPAAQFSGLKPAPDCRLRGTSPHLSHSCASPFLMVTLVTHGHKWDSSTYAAQPDLVRQPNEYVLATLPLRSTVSMIFHSRLLQTRSSNSLSCSRSIGSPDLQSTATQHRCVRGSAAISTLRI